MLLALPAAAPLFGQSTVTCSSDDMHRHYCSADTRGGVRLLRQRSDAACRQGYSWGTDRRGIWVDHGCRADFQVGGGGYSRGEGNGRYGRYERGREGRGGESGNGSAAVVTCSSDDMHRHFCAADTRGRVQLLRQHSQAQCREGYSWGVARGGVWVDHGCRADFSVGR